MRNFLTVFLFEFTDILKKKSSVITTVIIMLIVLGASLFPLVLAEEDKGVSDEEIPAFNLEEVAYDLSALDESSQQIIVQSLKIEENQLFNNLTKLEESINEEEFTVGFSALSLTSFKTIYFNRSGFTNYEGIFESVLRNTYRWKKYGELGVNPDEILEIEETPIENEVIINGRDSISNYMVTYVLSFVIYFVVLLYGNSVATAVAREKDSRTMELLITSTKPTYLIVGKVLAVMTFSFIQVALIFLAGFIGFNIAKEAYPQEILMVFQNSFTLDMILVTLYFFIVGYALYMFVYAALGSLITRMEDVSNAVTPLTFLGMIALFIAMFSINDINGVLNRVAAIVPFTSFIAMPTRYLLTVVSPLELIISMAALLLTTVLFAYVTIRMYRWGTLHYGNRIGFFKALRQIF